MNTHTTSEYTHRRTESAYHWADSVWQITRLAFVLPILILAGGVITGVTPALVAGAQAWDRATSGEVVTLGSIFETWKKSWKQANLAGLPLVILLGICVLNWLAATAGYLPAVWVPVAGVLAGFAAILLAWVAVIFTRYQAPWYAYAPNAGKLLLGWPLTTALLVMLTALCSAAAFWVPIALVPVVASLWFCIVSSLCLKTLAENEKRLAAPQASEERVPRPFSHLPNQPLAMK